MKDANKTLEQVLQEVDAFLKAASTAKAAGKFDSITEGLIPILLELSINADIAAAASSDAQRRFILQAYALRDLCIEVGHPNTLKEESRFEHIKEAFPEFVYIGADCNDYGSQPSP